MKSREENIRTKEPTRDPLAHTRVKEGGISKDKEKGR